MLNSPLKLKPYHLILIGYFFISFIFALILLLPFTHKGNLSFIDALFTSTSALCVTGLIVKDTGNFWTGWGKIIIIFLIQIGGLGYMTMISYFFLVLKGGLPISLRVMTRKTQSFIKGIPLRELILKVLLYTFIVELSGFILLSIFSKGEDKIFSSMFHSISAFCNAGFSNYSLNLVLYRDSPFYLIVVAILFILGGLGFFVLDDLYYFIKNKKSLSYHSKVVLKTTFFLIFFFCILFSLIEWNNSLKDFDFLNKVVHSFFQVTTPRTAGFNSLEIGELMMPTIFIIIFLMVIGGSPGGTAGGIKTTNFAVWAAFLRSIMKGEEEVYISKRKIENSFLIQSAMIFTLYVFLTGVSLFFLLLIEGNKFRFIEVLFEVISAFSTVGLSFGSKLYPNVSLSADFSILSKFIIILLMITGRIGVFTLWNIIIVRKKSFKKYPKGEFMLV